MITLPCSTCGTKNELPETMRGKIVECTFCFARLKVPLEENGTVVEIPGFTILEPLGAGAVGRVFKARQESMGRDVALKVIPRDNLKRPESGKRFTREVQTLAKLDHPNIVAAYESGETDDYYYLAMSFIDGESLDSLVSRRGFLAEHEALSVAYQVAQALRYAWDRQQLLHRDIKPSNIMISQEGEVKLMDLGISKSLGRDRRSTVTATGMVVGTPYYMSPEQAVSSQSMDRRSDIYSLGATLYEMVTGTKPFQGDNPLEVMGHHRFTPLPPARNRNRNVSEACELLLEIMMAKDKVDRYETWEELTSDITRVLNGQMPTRERPADAPPRPKGNSAPTQPRLKPIEAAPGKPKVRKSADKAKPAVPGRPPGQSAKQPASNFATVFAMMILLGGVLAVGLWLWHRSQPEAPPAASGPTVVEKPDEKVEPPPVSPTEAEEDATKADPWEERLAEAVNFWETNPRAYREAQQLFQMLLPGVPDSQARQQVESHLEAIRQVESQARADVMRNLRRQAQRYLDEGDYEEAVNIYLDYDGRMSQETAKRRTELAEQLLRRARTLRLAEAVDQTQYRDLLQRTALLIVSGKRSHALRYHEQGVDKLGLAGREDVRQADKLLTGLAAVDEQLLKSFEGDIGQEIQLHLTEGTVQFVVQNVTEGGLNGLVVERQGDTVARIKREVQLADLAPAERARRLGRAEEPSLVLARGLLAFEAKRFDIAHQQFGQVGGELAMALQGYALAAAGESGDRAAANAFGRLMQALDLEPADPPTQLVRGIWRSVPSEREMASLAAASARLRLGFGPTAWLQARHATLDALRQRLIYQPAVAIGAADEEALQRALGELARLNPGVQASKLNMGRGPNGFFVTTGNQGSLKEISPLMGLNIDSLDLAGSSVSDLAALRGMPLSSLYLAGTQVADLQPLRGLPLTHLDLAGTPVSQLRSLAGLPLREINLANCSQLQEVTPLLACTALTKVIVPRRELIDPLRQLPNLRQIGTSPDDLERISRGAEDRDRAAEDPDEQAEPPPADADDTALAAKLADQLNGALQQLKTANPEQAEWVYAYEPDGDKVALNLANNKHLTNLSPLAGHPISRLVLDETGVSDLAPLQGLRLTHLSLAGTQVTDISPLRGMSLVSLDLRGCPVKEVFPLFTMPLETLDISGTEIKDLRALTEMPLVVLRANQLGIKDLDPLARKDLTVLEIADCQVRDFKVIDNLRRLQVLKLSNTRFTDVDLLENKKLTTLHLDGTRIENIRVLAWMPLVELQLHGCQDLKDLTPLMSCQELERLTVPRQANVSVLRKHPKLKAINVVADPEWSLSAKAFWENNR